MTDVEVEGFFDREAIIWTTDSDKSIGRALKLYTPGESHPISPIMVRLRENLEVFPFEPSDLESTGYYRGTGAAHYKAIDGLLSDCQPEP